MVIRWKTVALATVFRVFEALLAWLLRGVRVEIAGQAIQPPPTTSSES